MSGPSNSDRAGLSKSLERREYWSEVFGWLVGAGLLIEFGREIYDCFVRWHLPSMELVGGLLVTAGVFGEVWFSHLVANTARSLSELSDSDVAQANKLAADALKAAAEANLARAEIEAHFAPRRLTPLGHQKLVETLKRDAGRSIDIVGFDEHVGEVYVLFNDFEQIFKDAGWTVNLTWLLSGRRISGEGIAFGLARETKEPDNSDLQRIISAVRSILAGDGIPCVRDHLKT